MVGDARLGTELAGHRIERIIGRGGSSVVYLAEHVRLGRWVALKLLAAHLADDDAFRTRFIRESRLAARLDHPSIVTVYDAGEADGVLYLSMRYVEGTDLGRAVAREGALDTWRTMTLLRQVAGALDAAHDEGLVHRDVKPGNILLSSGGSGVERAYLSDFGVTKRMTSRSALTRSGQFVGTVDYVAPEQIAGGSVDGRADVYSLGCVLYQCLTGSVPFPRESDVATIYGHLQDPPPSIGALGEERPGLNEVVARSLAKMPDDRYPTCGSLMEAARSAIGEPTVAHDRPDPPAREASYVETITPAGPSATGDHLDDAQITDVIDRPRRSRPHLRWAFVLAAAVLAAAAAVALVRLDRPTASPPASLASGSAGSGGADPQAWQSFLWNREKAQAGFGGTGEQAILDGASIPGGVIAVGHVAHTGDVSDVGIWTSTNGQDWRWALTPAQRMPREQRATSVAVLGDVLVAAGWNDNGTDMDAMAWRSTDGGESWSSVSPPLWSSSGDQVIRDVTSIDGSLIAVGYDDASGDREGAAWRSTDGLTWEPMADADLGGIGDQELYAVVADGRTAVAGGYSTERGDEDAAFWSLEGDDWQRAADEALDADGSQEAVAIARGTAGRLVAVGSDDVEGHKQVAVWRSEDGRSWARVAIDPAVAGGGSDQEMVAITAYHGGFVAGGHAPSERGDRDAAAWISPDGQGWMRGDPSSLWLFDLGGAADQEIRALVNFGHSHLALLAMGVDHAEAAENAMIWGGAPSSA